MKYSIIVPVFNRPDEVDELLQSLCEQKLQDFEVIIVEDGSKIPCKDVCDKYAGILDLHYYYKENSGPGQSRNYGAERARGEWLIVLDSDVVLPEGYLQAIDEQTREEGRKDGVLLTNGRKDEQTREDGRKDGVLLTNGRKDERTREDGRKDGVLLTNGRKDERTREDGRKGEGTTFSENRPFVHSSENDRQFVHSSENDRPFVHSSKESRSFVHSSENDCPFVHSSESDHPFVAFGGPDASHPSFTPVQKAISYAMTSFFTTGGIRGGKGKKLDKFYPRSYNMGIRREVYLQLGGFSKMRFGEDIDFSYRIVEAGYQTALIPEAWVWHKRRTDFRKFFRQVYNSGIARINLEKRHPGTLKLVHLLPTIFTVGTLAMLAIALIGLLFMLLGCFAASEPGCNPAPIAIMAGGCVSLIAISPLLLYSLIIYIDSSIKNRSLRVGLLSVPAAFTQLMGYGLGFIDSWWKRCVLKKEEFPHSEQTEADRQAFEKKFYE